MRQRNWKRDPLGCVRESGISSETMFFHDFTEKDVVPMPKIVMNEKITFMDRVANYNGKLVVLLDVTRLLSEEEMEKVKKLKEDLK